MKRMSCLLLTLLLLLSACASQRPQPQNPVAFFYPVNAIYTQDFTDGPNGRSSPVIRAEPGESSGHEGDYRYLLNLYFRGPWSKKLHNPFPAGLTVVDFRTPNNTAVLKVSKEYGTLSGIDLTLASACIAKTVQALTGCERLQLSAVDCTLEGTSHLFIDCSELLEKDLFVEPEPATEP